LIKEGWEQVGGPSLLIPSAQKANVAKLTKKKREWSRLQMNTPDDFNPPRLSGDI
jgi:hypothetical protein